MINHSIFLKGITQSYGVSDVISDECTPIDSSFRSSLKLGIKVWSQLNFLRLLKGNLFVKEARGHRVK